MEAKLLREAYRQFNAGATLGSIAARWNAAGLTTPLGNPWSGTRVREVLLLARNAGLREYGGQLVVDEHGNPKKGAWPAIVKEEVWRAARERIDGKRGGPYRGRKYLLSGIVLCGLCGAAMTSHISARGKLQYACFRCRKVSRSAEKLDELITEAVVRRLSAEDAVELLRPAVEEVDASELREQRRALKARLAQLGKEFASAPPEFTQAALGEITAKLAEIDAVLNDPGKAAIFEDVIGAPDVRKAFDSLDLGRQRTIVDALMTITVNPVGKATGGVWDPDAIDVDWKT
ncbi:recombinase family protein [Mycobacterium interjectum]|nr:recombinase family protein [Mycobacterium interjectum]